MEKNAPEISVIVPVYNVEQYLVKCIDSILSQTFTDFELLLIDDGSPDRCGEICDEYAKKDERIRVFHQENSGVSTARNIGLEMMKGQYLAFVDADDWIYPHYLQYLYEALQGNEAAGLIIHGFQSFDTNGIPLPAKLLPNRFYRKEKFGYAICECRLTEWGYSASKLYKADIIRANHLRFDTRLHCLEDLLFMDQYLLYCDYLLLGDKQEYAYIRHPNSMSSTIHPFDSVYAGFQLYQSLFVRMSDCWYFPEENREVLIYSMMLGFDWSLKTDYQCNREVSRSLRLSHLAQLVNENYETMCLYYRPVYKLDKIGKLFLKFKCYSLYDVYIILLIKLKVHRFLYAPKSK